MNKEANYIYEPNYIHHFCGIEIIKIDLITQSNKKLEVLNCVDTVNHCICDTLEKYLNSYYRNPRRMRTAFELTTLDKYKHHHGNLKIGIKSPLICIYPYKDRSYNTTNKRLKIKR
jgi:hypothetical protein